MGYKAFIFHHLFFSSLLSFKDLGDGKPGRGKMGIGYRSFGRGRGSPKETRREFTPPKTYKARDAGELGKGSWKKETNFKLVTNHLVLAVFRQRMEILPIPRRWQVRKGFAQYTSSRPNPNPKSLRSPRRGWARQRNRNIPRTQNSTCSKVNNAIENANTFKQVQYRS